MSESLVDREVDLDPTGAYAARAAARRSGGDALFGSIPSDDAALLALAEERQSARDPAHLRVVWNALADRWSALDLPDAARSNVERLAGNPETSVVIAGQQPAIAGGTMLHWAKALSAVGLAKRLEALGHPTVPLIWIADEDHDVGELFSGWFPRGDDLREVKSPFRPGRRSISALRFPEGGAEVIRALRDLGLESAPLFDDLAERSDASPSVAFRELLLHALPATGLLPMHPAWLRAQQREGIAAELESPGKLAAEVAIASEAMQHAGVEPPIPTVSELPLFWIDDTGARHRLDRSGDRWTVRGGDADAPSPPGFPDGGFGSAEAASWARREPTRFSPDALLRPLLQDSALQPFAVITGPTEMAYQLQLVESYRARGIARPVPFHRLRARLLKADEYEALQSAGVELSELAEERPVEELVPSPEAKAEIAELQDRAAVFRDGLRALSESDEASGALAKRVERLNRRLGADLEKLAAAIEREWVGSVGDRRQLVESVRRWLWVKGVPAERVVSILEFSRRHGRTLFDTLLASYAPYDERERWLVPEPNRESSPTKAEPL